MIRISANTFVKATGIYQLQKGEDTKLQKILGFPQ
jgi:hypothetical protein